MLKLAQRSSVLGTSARLLASSSVVKQQERNGSASSKKAVVFNLGGAIVPAMSPVLSKHAQEKGLTEAELTSKLFVEGDQELFAQVEPSLLSKHGSRSPALFDVVSAIKSIRGEGLKTALIADAGGLNGDLIPLDKGLFDTVSTEFNSNIAEMMNANPNEVVYVDNIEANLKAAEALGLTTVNVENIEAALNDLEGKLEVPLKEMLPGLTWIYYDSSHNPYKRGGENALFYFICMMLYLQVGYFTTKYILKIDGEQQH